MQSTMLSQNTVEDVKVHTSGASYSEEKAKNCEQKFWKLSHIESDEKRESTQKQPYSLALLDSPTDVASRIDATDAKAMLDATEWHPSDIQLLIYFIS